MRLALSIAGAGVLVMCATVTVAPAQSPTPRACAAAEHRQFDFWLGEWEVTVPNGNAAGVNRITSINGGCALREEWTGAAGFTGTSINAYDPGSGRWHQTWIGSDGVLLLLDGGFRDGAMEMTGVTVGRDGAKTHHRIRWTPHSGSPAGLRQLWESSTDGGKTWAVAFDGTYRKRQ
jgi:hypothetical protein